jgi:hypothetical protein
MTEFQERRREKRLRYQWPVWFAEDFDDVLVQGQMVDVSSGGAAFTCYSDQDCPYPGQNITARFSIPRFSHDGEFDMSDFTCNGSVKRVEQMNPFLCRVAVQFAQPLPFKPGEQAENEFEAQQRLKAVTI